MRKLSDHRMNKIKAVVAQRQSGLVVVLEDIHDPHNAAAILRTCDAFGIQRVVFIFEKEESYNPRRIGKLSSSSANKWLTLDIYKSTEECLKNLKKEKFEIVATALTKNSQNLYEASLTGEKLALIIGNEHRGVSEAILKNSDRVIMLPMSGMVQSLNASVSAALFIYEIIRQRRESGRGYSLSKSESKALINTFSEKA